MEEMIFPWANVVLDTTDFVILHTKNCQCTYCHSQGQIQTTGGTPASSLSISRSYWVKLDRPSCIEEYYERQTHHTSGTFKVDPDGLVRINDKVSYK